MVRTGAANLTESDACQALFLYERNPNQDCVWLNCRIKPDLYRFVIAPHFRQIKKDSETPFEWAKGRVAAAYGMAHTLVGKDFPFTAVEQPYMKTAALVCNQWSARDSRHTFLVKDSETTDLLKLLGDQPLPEALYLALALRDSTSPAVLIESDLCGFLDNLPAYLQNGLRVDRVVELANHLISNGSEASTDLVNHVLYITAAVYESTDRPWWFHEDQPLFPNIGRSDWGSDQVLENHRQIASATGPAYQYAKEVWDSSGAELLKFSGVQLSDAVALVAEVTTDYGIGNVQRAKNVLNFARAALAEVEPSERPDLCKILIATFADHKPSSPIIGSLEEGNVDFHKPGLLGLTRNLRSHDPPQTVDVTKDLIFHPERLRKLVRSTNQPLRTRAGLVEVDQLGYHSRHKLITHVTRYAAGQLPVPDRYRSVSYTDRPLNTWLNFDQKLKSEVAVENRSKVAQLYFTCFANKMPEPFNPPDGFLFIFQKLASVSFPEDLFAPFEAPSQRSAVAEANAQNKIDRWALIGCWLDTAVLGILSYTEVLDLFRWALLDSGNIDSEPNYISEDLRNLQIDGLWEYYWSKERREAPYQQENSWLIHDRELRYFQAAYEALVLYWAELAYYDDPDPHIHKALEWSRNKLDEVREKRRDLPTDWDRHINWYKREDRLEELPDLKDDLTILKATQRYFSKKRDRNELTKKERILFQITESQIEMVETEIDDLRASRYTKASDCEGDINSIETAEQTKLRERHRRESAERWAVYEWSHIASSSVTTELQDRLSQLKYTIEFLSCINRLVAASILPADSLSIAVRVSVDHLKSGDTKFTEELEPTCTYLTTNLSVFNEIVRLELVNLEDVQVRLLDWSNRAQLTTNLESIAAVIATYQNVRELIDLKLATGLRAASAQNYNQDVQAEITVSVRDCLNNGSPLFAPYAAETIVDEFFWLERYQTIKPHLQAFLNTLPGNNLTQLAMGSTEIVAALQTGFRTAAATWWFTFASQLFRSQGKAPFQIAVLDQPLSRPNSASAVQNQPLTVVPDVATTDSGTTQFVPLHLTRDIDTEFKQFTERLIECRRRDFGYLATGGKIHVIHKADSYRLQFLRSCYGFSRTTFMLDQADEMLILPPTASWSEIALIAEFLNIEGIIDWEFPEIQICIAGRLNLKNCAYLGASIMAGTDANVPYSPRSFDTNSDPLTAFRMIIYDDKGLRDKFPFDVTREGRTDVLGRRTLSDFGLVQRVGSLLSYSEEPLDGSNLTVTTAHLEEFHRLAEQYRNSLKTILNDHDLANVLSHLWLNPVYLQQTRSQDSQERRWRDGLRHFNGAIKPMMDAWNQCADEAENTGKMDGVVGAVQTLIEETANSIRPIQEDMLNSREYSRHRELLLNPRFLYH